ncbi:MAG: peptidylprolyl isomerase [Flavobacteriales bacterium]
MKHQLFGIVLLSMAACGGATSVEQAPPPAVNKWADDRLWAVLEAQEQRDAKVLCAMLSDSAAEVREAAALALAGVQDSSARYCLFAALKDVEPMVRKRAALALSLVADSVALDHLNAVADAEKDTAVQQAMQEAGFRAELGLRKHDTMFLISYLESDDRDIRTRAAQALARLPQEELISQSDGVMHAISVEKDVAVRAFLIGALKHKATADVVGRLVALAGDGLPTIRAAALRALGAPVPGDQKTDPVIFYKALDDADPNVRQLAVQFLVEHKAELDGTTLWKVAQEHSDYSVKIPLYGLVMSQGDEGAKTVCAALMTSIAQQDLGPYLNAALITTRSSQWSTDTLLSMLGAQHPAVERQALLAAAIAGVRERMARSRFASREAQYADLRKVVDAGFATGDVGLIAAICEELDKEEGDVLKLLVDDKMKSATKGVLLPIRDLETIQLLEGLFAKRDGLPPPEHKAPPFNHGIDRQRLLKLKQGQEYRIATNRGDIVIATNVDETPGSSLAFDSLVTAGYYNGKYFHRVVPNFVVQGGCPRGDGYGGMPWTLRTEIGSTGYTTGAVGLASAGRDTESCQFFITHMPTPHLDGRYTKFGDVVSGMEVVQRIALGDQIILVERVE